MGILRAMMLKRTDWAKLHRFCWICGETSGLQTHEICRGTHRKAALREPTAWVRCCVACHDLLADYSIWPPERQYALKANRDPKHYDRDILNRLRGRAENAISTADVVAETIDSVPVYLVDQFC